MSMSTTVQFAFGKCFKVVWVSSGILNLRFMYYLVFFVF